MWWWRGVSIVSVGNEAWWNSYRGNLWAVLGPGMYSINNVVLRQTGLLFHLQSVYPICLGWTVSQRDHWCKDFWFCERYLRRPKRSQDCHSSKWASSCGDRCVTQIIRFLLLWGVLWTPVWYVELKGVGQAMFGVFCSCFWLWTVHAKRTMKYLLTPFAVVILWSHRLSSPFVYLA